jgi:hypothetical protein
MHRLLKLTMTIKGDLRHTSTSLSGETRLLDAIQSLGKVQGDGLQD